MKTRILALACASLALVLMAMSNGVAAETATVPAFGWATKTVSVDEGDTLAIEWSSDASLTYVMVAPDLSTVETHTGISYVQMIDVDQTGTYTLTWTNIGSSSVSLTYTVTVIPFGDVSDAISGLMLGVIIVGVIIVVIVVVVVLVVVMGGRKKPQAPVQQMYMAPPGQAPSGPGMCPACGNRVDPAFQFCQRCGAKVR